MAEKRKTAQIQRLYSQATSGHLWKVVTSKRFDSALSEETPQLIDATCERHPESNGVKQNF